MEITPQILQTLISISLISVFVTGYYQPLNPAREWVTEKWIKFFAKYRMWKTAEISILWNCSKCLAFTTTLFVTWNIPAAILSSIIALIIKYIIKYVSQSRSRFSSGYMLLKTLIQLNYLLYIHVLGHNHLQAIGHLLY